MAWLGYPPYWLGRARRCAYYPSCTMLNFIAYGPRVTWNRNRGPFYRARW